MGIAGELPGESLVRGSGGGLVFIKVLSRSFESPWAVARQAPWSMGFSRREYWSGLPFPSPGDLPDPGMEPGSPALQADSSCWATREEEGAGVYFVCFGGWGGGCLVP